METPLSLQCSYHKRILLLFKWHTVKMRHLLYLSVEPKYFDLCSWN